MVVRPAVDGDWPKAEPLLRASGGVRGGVAARFGAVARSSSDCLLVADVYAQDIGADARGGDDEAL